MRKWHITMGTLVIFFGALLFFGGFYLLPFGTDIYLWFWVVVVAKGNWLIGDILANAAALGMMFFGGFILWREGKHPWKEVHA